MPAEWKGRSVSVRFGCATHTATVYVNGAELVSHEGGFLPFSADITEVAIYGGMNHIAVKVNNELSETRMPCGQVRTLADGSRRAAPYFDFYNYAGLQRNVWLVALPKERIEDYELVHSLSGADAFVSYRVMTSGGAKVYVQLYDETGSLAAENEGAEGVLTVKNARLWKVRDACLYTIVLRLLDGDTMLDEYREGRQILLNGEPVYLKGFGKHEDADIIGRGFSPAVMKRDFELMKWIGANSFRTSHYPYSEEIYQMADREGFLVIDEVQAVGCFPSLMNFAEAGTGKKTAFFARETTWRR